MIKNIYCLKKISENRIFLALQNKYILKTSGSSNECFLYSEIPRISDCLFLTKKEAKNKHE